MDDEYGYDEGSDIDNWEAEQVFRDHEGEDFSDEDSPEVLFRDAFEKAFSVRPVFSVDYLSDDELLERAEAIQDAHAARRFV